MTLRPSLQTLWDEQLLGHRPSSSSSTPSYGHLNWQSWEEDEWRAHDPWENDDPWWESQWHEEWQDDHLWPDEEPASSLAVAEEPDEQILEAQKAEQAAEQLALEAKRTWAEAQRTTQQMKKDRGFGQHTGNKCFNCGGNHFVRDCPDRRVPMFGKHVKGKGKFGNYMDSYPHDMFFMKGKSKKGSGKNKSKSSYMLEPHDMFWTSSRYKGKGKGFSGGKSTPSVNAYATRHFDIGGLELCTSAEADLGAAQRSENPSVDNHGSLRCFHCQTPKSCL